MVITCQIPDSIYQHMSVKLDNYRDTSEDYSFNGSFSAKMIK